jgi:hypothetical protein
MDKSWQSASCDVAHFKETGAPGTFVTLDHANDFHPVTEQQENTMTTKKRRKTQKVAKK